VQFKKLCADNYGTRTVSLALGIYDSDWKSSLSSFDIGKMSKSGAKSTINEHIKNIFEEGELIETSCLQKFGISEFQQKTPNSRSSTCSAGHVEAR
jgi:hypothetical protein